LNKKKRERDQRDVTPRGERRIALLTPYTKKKKDISFVALSCDLERREGD